MVVVKKREWIAPLIMIVILVGLAALAICSQIREYHTPADAVLDRIIEKLHPVFSGENYSGELECLNKRDILSEIKVYRGKKSYTINKEKVYICMLDENGEYYDENMLTYVVLHELSHVVCDEIGHTDKFHRIFDEVLARATDEGVYDPSIPVIRNYCMH